MKAWIWSRVANPFGAKCHDHPPMISSPPASGSSPLEARSAFRLMSRRTKRALVFGERTCYLEVGSTRVGLGVSLLLLPLPTPSKGHDSMAKLSRFSPIPKENIVYITFSGPIDDNAERSLLADCTKAIDQGAQTIYLMISTPGGSVLHGMNLYSMLQALPARLIAHNIASVDSIGTVVFLSASERYASPHATFLFHGVSRNFPKDTALNRRDLRESLEKLTTDHEKIASIVHRRTSFRSTDDVLSLMEEPTTKDAEFAQSVGIIHGVRTIKIPRGVPTHYLLTGSAKQQSPASQGRR